MKLNKPTSLTQGDVTLAGTLVEYAKTEDGARFTVFIPRKKSVETIKEATIKSVSLLASGGTGKLDDDGPSFDLDLSTFPVDTDAPGEAYVDASRAQVTAPTVEPGARLERLLEPYSSDGIAKAKKLLKQGLVQEAKRDAQSTWFNVQGSTLYVVKITKGDDFLFAECSCPNGVHRGGDAICYHSIAARVADAELVEEWIGFPSA